MSAPRRLAAWVLLGVLLVAAAFVLPRVTDHPAAQRTADVILWSLVAYGAIRVISFLLLDPLLSHRQTATPGFARDLLVVALYLVAAGGILRHALQVSLGQLLGTGAIAAAVVGLSLQEVLGNLFAGISLHLDPAFREGDWLEITGNLRGGPGRETLIGQVEAMTWRTVQLRTENGDTDIFPNRVMAQAVVTNLYVPSGLHRRTAKVIVEPRPDLHVALEKLSRALAGLPHHSHHRPEVVVHSSDMGGAVLEMRFWALGFRHGRQATFQATRLAATVLSREGFRFMGPHGPTPLPPVDEPVPGPTLMGELIQNLGLPSHWMEDLRPHLRLRPVAPGEAVIREGDPGNSLFAVHRGTLQVVHPEERLEPYTGIYWKAVADLGPGQWFGEASLLTGAPRNATVVALTEAAILELPKEAFDHSLRREPELLEQLIDLMDRRERETTAAVPPKEGRRNQWTRQIRAWFGLD
ncbi:mechanosensitive ion channel family protein [Geothrix sp. PMB-07]|uniref:mechanosensitive ion channel family protein n=1 Tax=Geothrix sp. PMB-07 TaxID=3068640 RepID=UPI0027403323|nr:mechanosensitive ion channel family protein [Geothrix sp. PMB-07]WLT31400.1 mechanosensitive ion channel family protein [Geothrix sp. PMB-07]